MKKCLSVILASLLSCSLLLGCGKSANEVAESNANKTEAAQADSKEEKSSRSFLPFSKFSSQGRKFLFYGP